MKIIYFKSKKANFLDYSHKIQGSKQKALKLQHNIKQKNSCIQNNSTTLGKKIYRYFL